MLLLLALRALFVLLAFFVGGLVKTVLTHYGGARAYERGKPLMIGLVAGHLLAEFTRFVVAMVYSLCTGHPLPG